MHQLGDRGRVSANQNESQRSSGTGQIHRLQHGLNRPAAQSFQSAQQSSEWDVAIPMHKAANRLEEYQDGFEGGFGAFSFPAAFVENAGAVCSADHDWKQVPRCSHIARCDNQIPFWPEPNLSRFPGLGEQFFVFLAR